MTGLGMGIRLHHRQHGSGGGGGGGFTRHLGMNLAEFQQHYVYNGAFLELVPGETIGCQGSAAATTTGNTTLNSNVINITGSTSNIVVGQVVSGVGLTGSPQVISVSGATVQIEYDASSTQTNTSLTFTSVSQVPPEAYCDADGWPTSYPPGITSFSMAIQGQVGPVGVQHTLTWQGNVGVITWSGGGPTGVGTQGANSMTVTPATAKFLHDNGFYNIFNWTLPGSGYPKNFSCRPTTGDPGGTTTSSFRSTLQGVMSTDAAWRPMHSVSAVESDGRPNGWTDTNHDFGYAALKFPQDGDLKLKDKILTAANRSKTTSASFWQRRDGMPVETIINIATELNLSPWYNVPWNIDGTDSSGTWTSSTFLSGDGTNPGVATLFANFSKATGLYTYVENANEVWNGGYMVARQCATEGLALGLDLSYSLPSVKRYGQKTAQVMEAFEAAFNAQGIGPANGSANRLVRVAAWQNAASPSIWDTMCGVPYKTGTVGDHIDAFSTSIYPDPTTQGVAKTYTGPDLTPVWTALYTAVDSELNNASGHYAKAASLGKGYHPYEAGLQIIFTDQTFFNSVIHSAGIHDPEAYFLNEMARRLPNAKPCYYEFCTPPALLSGNYNSWALLETISDTLDSTRSRYLAVSEGVANTFTMRDPALIDVAAASNTPAATEVGQFTTGILPEATLSLTSDNGGQFTVVRTTDSFGSTIGSLRTTTGNPTQGAASVTLRQTDPHGNTHDTVYNFTVSAPLPVDNFNDGVMDSTIWQKDTTILAGAHGVLTTGVTTSETSGSLRIVASGSTSARQNGYTSVNQIDITQRTKNYCYISQFTNATGEEAYPLIFGASGGAIVRPRLAGTALTWDYYNSAGTGTFNQGSTAYNFATNPWIRLRYDATQGTSSGAPVSTMTNSTTTATVTTSAAHNMVTGNSVTVSGCTPTAYNGTFTITVTSATTFTYTMLSDPGGSASVVGTFTFTPAGKFFLDTAPSTASNPPIETNWTAGIGLVRPYFIATTGYLAFLKNGVTGTLGIECVNTASG